MRILALDASTEALSAALLDEHASRPVTEIFEIAPRAHARRLLPAAQRLLSDARLQLADLDGLAFAHGPGAFTGLRIAAGLVQGLAGALDLPVIGISTLAALAARAFDEAPAAQRVQVVQDARMGEIYTATYISDPALSPLGDERVLAPKNLEVIADSDTAWAGNGWSLVAEAQQLSMREIAACWPHAADVARLAAPRLAAGEGGLPDSALPVYVRDDVARKTAS